MTTAANLFLLVFAGIGAWFVISLCFTLAWLRLRQRERLSELEWTLSERGGASRAPNWAGPGDDGNPFLPPRSESVRALSTGAGTEGVPVGRREGRSDLPFNLTPEAGRPAPAESVSGWDWEEPRG